MTALTSSSPAATAGAPPRASDSDLRLSDAGLYTVLAAAFLAVADFFIVNVALPSIGSDLGASASGLELVVAAYGVSYALLLVLGGRLGDVYGRRRLLLIGVAAFTLASLACGLAPSEGVLVAARAAQGAAAAFMVPQVLGTIQARTSGPARSRALAMYGAMAGLAVATGQVAGGALVAADLGGVGWRAIFLVNAPIGVAALVVAPRVVPETRAGGPLRLDVGGTLVLGATVLALLVPLAEGRALHWPVWTYLVLAAVAPLAAVLVVVERRAESRGGTPLVPLSLLRRGGMRLGLVMAMLFFGCFSGFMFVFAVVTQQTLGLGPLESGATLAPLGVGFLVSSLATARLLVRWPARRVIASGAAVQAAGIALTALVVLVRWPAVRPLDLVATLTLTGVGQGLMAGPLFRVVLADVPTERAGVGSGVLMTAQQVALAMGATALGTLYLTIADKGRDAGGAARSGFLTVLAVQGCVALVVLALSQRLPAA